MKILLLCWRDTHHPQGGGSERDLERVGDFLVSQGHEVLWATRALGDPKCVPSLDPVVYYSSGPRLC